MKYFGLLKKILFYSEKNFMFIQAELANFIQIKGMISPTNIKAYDKKYQKLMIFDILNRI